MPSAAELASTIRHERAQTFLTSVRCSTAPPGRTFITTLDDHLYDSRPPSLSNLDSTLSRTDIIELQGPPSSGKTSLAMFLVMTAVLVGEWQVVFRPPVGSPARERNVCVAVGGKGKSAVWMDCDGRFDAVRLQKMVESHLQRRVEAETAADPSLFGWAPSAKRFDAAVRDCLRRVHVFAPTSSLSLAVTLSRLPAYHRSQCPHEELLYLVVDSVSAFFWQDRFRHEEALKFKQPPPRSMANVLKALGDARRQLGCVTFLTNWKLSSSPAPAAVPPRQHLPGPYPSPFTKSAPPPRLPLPSDPFALTDPIPIQLSHHITIFAPPVAPFPGGTSLPTAKARRHERDKVLEEAMGTGVVRAAVFEEVGEGRAGRWVEMGRFEFGVRDWGLETS